MTLGELGPIPRIHSAGFTANLEEWILRKDMKGVGTGLTVPKS